MYVYDDRIIVFYNIRGGKQVSSKDLYEALESPKDKENSKPETGSDLESSGGADHFKSEPKYIFVSGVFGCIFPWGEE